MAVFLKKRSPNRSNTSPKRLKNQGTTDIHGETNQENDKFNDGNDTFLATINIEEIENDKKAQLTDKSIINNKKKWFNLSLKSTTLHSNKAVKNDSPDSNVTEVEDSLEKKQNTGNESNKIFCSIHSDGLSQLGESITFQKQMETALLQCDMAMSPPNISLEGISSDLFTDSDKCNKESNNFSLSTEKTTRDDYNYCERTIQDFRSQMVLDFDILERSIVLRDNGNITIPELNLNDSVLKLQDQSVNNFNKTLNKNLLFQSLSVEKEFENNSRNLEKSARNLEVFIGDESMGVVANSPKRDMSLSCANNSNLQKIDLELFDWNESMVNGLQVTNVTKPDKLEKSNNSIEQINWNESMNKTLQNQQFNVLGPFFGLPFHVMNLIKHYKGIDKLYDWQEECLNLEAVRLRKNLVYSLPTSGGKTLVSEILIFREVLCRKKNALLILPYVSIVQEKLWTLSPFAVALDFLVEEYAAGKGTYPPRRRRNKKSLYVATMEKASGLINSLIETNRLSELGLIVVDELHLVGESDRGCVLENLLTKVLHSEEAIQIVGMSATIGNLSDICKFLNAELFTKDFRPVELEEFICCENKIAKFKHGEDLAIMQRKDNADYTDMQRKTDPNGLGSLVMEVIPDDSCLIFCPSKKNCENVALLLSKVLPREKLMAHKNVEKQSLINELSSEGMICDVLHKTLPLGVAYHHSGLTTDERRLIEDAFRAGILCVICCTSTLAAGVNLPAKRVILRSPYIGMQFINLSRYKQMVGRAGRAGYSEIGQSILVCEIKDLNRVIELLAAPMDEAISQLNSNDLRGLKSLLLSSIALGIATTRRELHNIVKCTLMAIQEIRFEKNLHQVTDEAIVYLFKANALHADDRLPPANVSVAMETTNCDNIMKSHVNKEELVIKKDTKISISKVGRAAIKGSLDLDKAHMLFDDLVQAQKSLVLLDSLHLLYLVTPYDLCNQVKPDRQNFYSIYSELGKRELKTADILGLTEGCMMRLYTGGSVKNITDRVFNRFYLTLMLHALWQGRSVPQVAQRFSVSRGLVQQLMTAASSFCNSVVGFCKEIEEFWTFDLLFTGMTQRLQYCCTKELLPLMELPSVKLSRAKQLYKAGYKNLHSIAKAEPAQLTRDIENLTRKVASQMIAASKMLLLEKVENLRGEAEDVLEGFTQDM